MWWNSVHWTEWAAAMLPAIDLARERDVDISGAFDEYGVDVADLSLPDFRVPSGFVLLILEALAEHDEFAGLKLGATAIPRSALSLAALHAPNLAAAVSTMRRHTRISGAIRIGELTHEGDMVVIPYRLPVESAENAPMIVRRQAVDWSLARLVNLVRHATGGRWNPSEVRFSYPRPKHVGPLEDWFRCRLRFLSNSTGIVMPVKSLSLPFTCANSQINHNLEGYLDRLEEDTPDMFDVVAQVNALLRLELGSQHGTLEGIAKRLGMSSRSLQRHLSDEKTSFRELTRTTRRAEASLRLCCTTESVESIACSLGYASSQAFCRAFVQWYGCRPSEFRRFIKTEQVV